MSLISSGQPRNGHLCCNECGEKMRLVCDHCDDQDQDEKDDREHIERQKTLKIDGVKEIEDIFGDNASTDVYPEVFVFPRYGKAGMWRAALHGVPGLFWKIGDGPTPEDAVRALRARLARDMASAAKRLKGDGA